MSFESSLVLSLTKPYTFNIIHQPSVELLFSVINELASHLHKSFLPFRITGLKKQSSTAVTEHQEKKKSLPSLLLLIFLQARGRFPAPLGL